MKSRIAIATAAVLVAVVAAGCSSTYGIDRCSDVIEPSPYTYDQLLDFQQRADAIAIDEGIIGYSSWPDDTLNRVFISVEHPFDPGDIPTDAVCWADWHGGFEPAPAVIEP